MMKTDQKVDVEEEEVEEENSEDLEEEEEEVQEEDTTIEMIIEEEMIDQVMEEVKDSIQTYKIKKTNRNKNNNEVFIEMICEIFMISYYIL